MKKTESFLYRFFAISILCATLLISGCGGGGGGGNYVGPEPEPDPTDVTLSSIKVTEDNKQYNESIPNTLNLAVDVPADGSYYLLDLTNKGSSDVAVKLCSSTGNTDVRMSVAEEKSYDIGDWTYDAGLMAKRSFIEESKAYQKRPKSRVSASLRASAARCSTSDHSKEIEGNEYTIQLGKMYKKPLVLLKRCKLVKITEHAKFFVDMDSHSGYPYQADAMEQFIKASDGLADCYERYIYSVLKDHYGTVADIDGDGKLSVLITNILPVWRSGLMGLFTIETMIPNQDDWCLDSTDPTNNITDFRDLVLITPNCDSAKDRHNMISNLIHETQHAVNFSQRSFTGNTYKKFDATAFADELGFDEGCSVAAEALLRRAMGKAGETCLYEYRRRNNGSNIEYAGNVSNFTNFAISEVYPFSDSNFNYNNHYGRNGLFMLYLHDCFGQDSFKKLIQQDWQGDNLKNTIPQILGCSNIAELHTGWLTALQNECLRTKLRKTNNSGKIGYADWLNLTNFGSIKNNELDNKSTPVTVSNPLRYSFQATKSNTGSKFRFFIKSADEKTSLSNLTLNLIKIANDKGK